MGLWEEFFVTLFLGGLGVHKFAKRKTALGILYLLTGGLFGIGWFVDTIGSFFRALGGSRKSAFEEKAQIKAEKKCMRAETAVYSSASQQQVNQPRKVRTKFPLAFAHFPGDINLENVIADFPEPGPGEAPICIIDGEEYELNFYYAYDSGRAENRLQHTIDLVSIEFRVDDWDYPEFKQMIHVRRQQYIDYYRVELSRFRELFSQLPADTDEEILEKARGKINRYARSIENMVNDEESI